MNIRWRHWITGIGLVVFGAAVGIAADRTLHRRGTPQERLLEAVRRDPVAVMDRELGLTPEQRTRIAAILEAHQDRFDTIWHDTHRRLRSSLDSLTNDIAAVLDSSQVVRLRTLADQVHGPASVPNARHSIPLH